MGTVPVPAMVKVACELAGTLSSKSSVAKGEPTVPAMGVPGVRVVGVRAMIVKASDTR